MTTTPTIWKASFVANALDQPGNQSLPQSIGLANGNFLTIWQDDEFGPGAGIDIVGQLFDPQGNTIGNPFQVNTQFVNEDETLPKIVAMPDGGYVMAYASHLDATGTFIVVQRYDSSGNPIASREIVENGPNNNTISDWEVTADSVGNYTVVFQLLSDDTFHTGSPNLSTNIHSITYDHSTNNAGLELINTARNDRDEPDYLASIASLANGNLVTLSDDVVTSGVLISNSAGSVDFKIINPQTGAVIRDTTRLSGGDPGDFSFTDSTPLDLDVLTGGQIVVLYRAHSESDNFGRMAFRIVADGSASGAVGPEITVVGDVFGSDQKGGQVIALRDGTFFVAWSFNSTGGGQLDGQRYSANGTPIGSQVILALDAVDYAFNAHQPHMSLTADGRILVPYENLSGEVSEVIVDPRDTTIFGTNVGETITTQITGTSIFGEGGDDTLLGQAGNDFLDGGLGTDTLEGGPGDDVYVLNDVHRISPLIGKFVYDRIVELPGQGTDTVEVSRVSNATTGYALPANVENGIVEGSGAFDLFGNEVANQLTGNADANRLDGGLGNDTLTGGLGADIFIFAPGYGADTITDVSAAQGDTIDVSGFSNLHGLAQITTHASQIGADTLIDFGNGDTLRLAGFSVSNLASLHFTFAPYTTSSVPNVHANARQYMEVHSNDLTYAGTASGSNHFIDYLNFEASFPDLIHAFGTNQQAMQDWYNHNESTERRVETFDGLDYIASYRDLISGFRSAGSLPAVQDAGAMHFVTSGLAEGRSTTLNGLDYIASYSDLVAGFGANSDAGAYHYIESGVNEGRTTSFDGLDYIASYADLISGFGANEQAGAAHYINSGSREGRTTTFNGLDYIASNSDLIAAYGVDADAGATHYIEHGHSEGRTTTFDGLDYIASYSDLIRGFGSNEQAGAAHYIQAGAHEGRTTSFDGLAYIANYTDLMHAFGPNNDAGASHYITSGFNEGRATTFDVAGYEAAHPDLQGQFASNDAFLAAYINNYTATGTFLT